MPEIKIEKRNRIKKKKRVSIRTKLMAGIGAVVFLTLVITSLVFYMYSSSVLKNKYENDNKRFVATSSENIGIYMSKYEKSINDLSLEIKTVYDGNDTNPAITGFLRNIKENDPSIAATYFISAKTGYMNIYPWIDFGNALNTRVFKDTVAKDKMYWMEVYKDAITNKMMTSIVMPVKKNDVLIGVLGYDISLEGISVIRNQLQDGLDEKLIVLDNKGVAVSTFIPDQIGKNLSLQNSGKEKGVNDFFTSQNQMKKEYGWIDSLYSDQKLLNSQYSFNGDTYFVNGQTMKNTGWKVIAVTPVASISAKLSGFKYISILTLIGGLLLGGILVYFISRIIIGTLRKFSDVSKKTASGDLTTTVDVHNNDEVGDLANDFNLMITNVNHLIKKIIEDFGTINHTATGLDEIAKNNSTTIVEVTKSIEEIASANMSQSEEVEKGATAVHSANNVIGQLATQTETIKDVLNEATASMDAGIKDVNNLEVTYQKLEDTIEKVAAIVEDLNKKSTSISQVTEVIANISDQTNLLSLNASIEAARAGEHGRGFAVVAGEVRKLAEQSRESAKNIQDIISSIIEDTNSAVAVMAETNTINRTQKEAVDHVGQSIKALTSSLEEIINEVSGSTILVNRLNESKDSIGSVMDGLSASAQQVAASTEEILSSMEEQSSSTEEVSHYAMKLTELMSQLEVELKKFTTD
jgi:methyl-accepting chemotaxis protein